MQMQKKKTFPITTASVSLTTKWMILKRSHTDHQMMFVIRQETKAGEHSNRFASAHKTCRNTTEKASMSHSSIQTPSVCLENVFETPIPPLKKINSLTP